MATPAAHARAATTPADRPTRPSDRGVAAAGALASATARLLAGHRADGLPAVLGLLASSCGAGTAELREPGSDGQVLARAGVTTRGPDRRSRYELPVPMGAPPVARLTLVGIGQPDPGVLEAKLGPALDVLGLAVTGLLAEAEAGGVVLAEEQEAERLSHQLHDGPMQALLAARYHLQLRGVQAGELDETVGAALSETRRLMTKLRPRALSLAELPSALEALDEQLSAHVVVRSHGLNSLARRTEPAAAAAYRLAQAVGETADRRGASLLTLRVGRENGGLVLHCTHDAEPAALLEDPAVGGWARRLTALHGRVREGERGLEAWVPLESAP